MPLETPAEVDALLDNATRAAAVFSEFDQQQVDRIVHAVYEAGFNNRIRLAKLAHEETGIGRWQDKVLKNVVATQFVYEDMKGLKTVGVIAEDSDKGIVEIAQPMGPILAIIPVTNPTSTTMFKILIALKTRNPIIICPPKKAIRCCVEAARRCYEAALQEDAPEDCIQWLTEVSREQTHALMSHQKLALILATGGSSLVQSAYSSGTPTLGVGAGNVPVFIEASADVPFAVGQILLSKLFDNGTICASEQAVVVEQRVAPQVIAQFQKGGACFLDDAEIRKLEAVAYNSEKGLMNPDIVGKSAIEIAEKAGLTVPPETRLLIAPLKGVGREYPLSSEILAPILAFYVVEDFDRAVNRCIDLNFYGGIGHTVSIFSNDEQKIKEFALLMNAGRIVVNTPSSQGAVGGIFNKINPSFTLGCGTGGKNITTENVTARSLLNIQRIARRRENQRLTHFDQNLYLDESLDARAIETAFNRNY
ncbi:MAG: aldehyde dehydrogenase family protein [Verrucomicrobia bacterium]|nr:aldehyde dehydrogenase family protein [Verrucomicrobiota bacterium]